MDALSSNFIPFCTAILGVALFLCKNHNLKITGAWFIAEFICQMITVGFSDYADASEMRMYRYLYACTAIQFMLYTIMNRSFYSDKLRHVFLVIAAASVFSGGYHWFVQSSWGSWGESFYENYHLYIEWSYFILVLGLEAFMIIIGVISVFTDSANSNTGKRNSSDRR